jgi:predicted amidohydrolase
MFCHFFSGKISLREIIENIKLTGVENNIISTDLSPINSPYPVEGLAIFIKKLLENGFTVNEIQKMTIDNPKKLLEN